MKPGLEIGLYTLGDHIKDVHTNHKISAQERIQNMIEMGQLAEQAGFDIFQIGESHQKDFVSQAHLIILSALAQSTKTIRLASGATIIGVADPVRVYEQAATIDLISNGRMEIMVGRSARTGIYEVLGYHLDDYETLFDEKYALLKLINRQPIVNWQGEYRAPLNNIAILPRAVQESGLPIWRAVGGSLSSATQAGIDGDAIYVMHHSGELSKYQTLVQTYRQAGLDEGHSSNLLKVAMAGYLYAGETTQQAIDFYYAYANEGSQVVNEMSLEKEVFDHAKRLDSAINIGEPSLLVEKLIHQYETLGLTRYVGQVDFGGMPFDEVKRTIDLLGSKVIPEVKKYTNK